MTFLDEAQTRLCLDDDIPTPAIWRPDMAAVALIDALNLPSFRRAAPEVVAGSAGLARPVRWVHATERSDVEQLLRAGDLMLTTGVGLPADSDTDGLRNFVARLAGVEAVGLVVELGRRWQGGLPRALLEACESRVIPLVALHRESRFAALAQEVGELIVNEQLAELRGAHRVHETFTELGLSLAGPADILDAVQRLADGPVVVEDARHRPIEYLAGHEDMSTFLEAWPERSARVRVEGRTAWEADNGWLLVRLGPGGQACGRLVISSPAPPSRRLVAAAERAAVALVLLRPHDGQRGLTRRAHGELLAGLRTHPDSTDVIRRCELAGFPTHRRRFLGLAVRPTAGVVTPPDLAGLAATAVGAAERLGLDALVLEVERALQILISVEPTADADVLADRLASRILQRHDVIVAAGQVAEERSGIARTLMEAGQVADAAPQNRDAPDLVHRLTEPRLRDLLAYAQDERLQLFVDRELSPLRAHDASDKARTNLVAALRALLLHPSSKKDAAASLYLSRAAFYDRLAKIEAVLGVDLDDPNVRVSLHVALVADEVLRASADQRCRRSSV